MFGRRGEPESGLWINPKATRSLKERELEHRTEIVLNSRAVLALVRDPEIPSDAGSALNELSGQGVRIAACGNALRGLAIDPGSLPPFVRVAPAGVVELVIRQAEGYAYIRP